MRSPEEFGGHPVLEETPAAQNVSQNDRDECDRIFETRTIVDGLRMLIHHEQADRGRSNGDWVGASRSVYANVGLPLRENEILGLTYPTAANDGLLNSFQVKVLKGPYGSTQNDPKGTVRERMHGSIYTPKDDAKGI